MELWEVGYQKDEELEADREGIYLAVQSAYSPYGAVAMFERFGKLCDEYVVHAQSPGQEITQLAIQSFPATFVLIRSPPNGLPKPTISSLRNTGRRARSKSRSACNTRFTTGMKRN